MSSANLLRVYLRAWRLLALGAFGGLVLAFIISIFQPLQFSSTIRLLITQTNATGIDPYTAIKSTERIGQNLAELVHSSSFFNAVIASGKVSAAGFPTDDEINKRQAWHDAVDIGVTPGTGVMEVVGYSTTREEATAIAVAVSEELARQAPNFFGYQVRVQIIDDPLPSRFYARPDFLQNSLVGMIFGYMLASALVLARIRRM